MSLVIGFGLPVSGVWATPENIVAIARRAEELGYGELWSYQRLLSPAEDDWGPQYRSVLDPIVALSFAAAATSLRRVGRLADGWISSSRFDARRIGQAVATIRQSAESAGRDPSTLRVVVRGVVRLDEDVRDPAGERVPLTGPADAVRADLAVLAEHGATDV